MSSSTTDWEECMSKKHNKPFWFNKVTGESRWTPPDSDIDDLSIFERAVSSGGSARDTERIVEETPPSAKSKVGSTEAELVTVGEELSVECPTHLSGKRDFLFRGFDPNKKSRSTFSFVPIQHNTQL